MDPLNNIDESWMLRISFVFTGSFLLYAGFQNWIKGKLYINPEIMILCLITYAAAFIIFILSLTRDEDLLRFRHIPLFALIFIVLFATYVVSEIFYNGVYRTDTIALTHYAALKYMSIGVNPYTIDLRGALMMFPIDPEYITFTETGDLITTLNYPALHFLVYIPFIEIGLTDMRWVTILFEIAVFILLYWKAPKKLRPIVLLPLFAGSDVVINFTAGCVTDFLWVLPLVSTVLFINNPFISAASFGLACSIKQEPWLFAPFILTWVWMETEGERRRRIVGVVRFAAISLGAFFISNLWFLGDIAAWWKGVTYPVFGNLIVQSQGLSMITQLGYLPLGKDFFLIATLTIYLLLIVNYVVYYDRLKYTFWIFPAVALWFSYRGLQSYFIHLIPLVAAAAITWYNSTRENQK